jgi:protein-L-isoaspartate O-methyltransferase
MSRTAYDEQAYPYAVRAGTHVARLGTVAQLIGYPTAPSERCRVMEIGGGDGINLISMALQSPGSEFLSFDLADEATQRGRALLARTGLSNVALETMDIMTVPKEVGSFDYIIAHGVYAWVPEAVRQGIMALIGRCLAPQGIAMVSYNALPGCRTRQILRDLMLDACRGIEQPAERVAAVRDRLAFFVERWDGSDAIQHALVSEARRFLERDDGVIFHDELGDFYAPQRFTEVVSTARAHGLDYLCDTQLGLLADVVWPTDLFDDTSHIHGGDLVAFEQLRDDLDVRSFRQSLFRRAGPAPPRSWNPERAFGLHVDGSLTPIDGGADGAQRLRTRGGGEIETRDPRMLAALARLTDAFPASLPLSDVTSDPALVDALVQLFLMGSVEMTTAPFRLAPTPSERPRASLLARIQAEWGGVDVTSLRHTVVQLADPGARTFLTLCDGGRHVDEIAVTMAEKLDLPLSKAQERTRQGLAALARLGLFEQ